MFVAETIEELSELNTVNAQAKKRRYLPHNLSVFKITDLNRAIRGHLKLKLKFEISVLSENISLYSLYSLFFYFLKDGLFPLELVKEPNIYSESRNQTFTRS